MSMSMSATEIPKNVDNDVTVEVAQSRQMSMAKDFEDKVLLVKFQRVTQTGVSHRIKILLDDAPRAPTDPEIPTQPWPATGALGLSERQLARVQAAWDSLVDKKDKFMSDYFTMLFELPQARKPFLVPAPERMPKGLNIQDLKVFKNHVFLQKNSWEVILDQVCLGEAKLLELAQGIGTRHLKFANSVVFEPWMWNHLITCFMKNMKTWFPDMDSAVALSFQRILTWFSTHMHKTYHNAGKTDYE